MLKTPLIISHLYDSLGGTHGRVCFSSTTASKTITYTYDNLHRLTFASTTEATSTPFIERYNYSSIGNITEMKNNDNATTTYTYAETGYANPHAATSIGGTSLTYDNNGNVTAYGSKSYEWDYRNRLASSTESGNDINYTYDHTNQRVIKATTATTTVYANQYYNVQNGATTTKHIYAGGELIATITTEGATTETKYLHTDHLGGLNASTDESGALAEVTDYYPYGSQRISTLYSGDSEQRKFTGHEYDTESNLTYANARYYEQNVGRWLSQDMESRDNPNQSLADPQQLNFYSYARNNPLVLFDPAGRKVWDFQPYLPSNGSRFISGEEIGQYKSVDIFSRGERTSGSTPYQCAIFVQNFASSKLGFNLWSMDNAANFGNQDKVNESFRASNPGRIGSASVYNNGGNVMPQENDIISWSDGNSGHVGIIAEVQFDSSTGRGWVYSVEQNYGSQRGIFAQSFTRTHNDSGQAVYTVSNRDSSLTTQAWTRYNDPNNQSGGESYTKTLWTPTPKPAIRK